MSESPEVNSSTDKKNKKSITIAIVVVAVIAIACVAYAFMKPDSLESQLKKTSLEVVKEARSIGSNSVYNFTENIGKIAENSYQYEIFGSSEFMNIPESKMTLVNDKESKVLMLLTDIIGESNINLYVTEEKGMFNFNGSKTYGFDTATFVEDCDTNLGTDLGSVLNDANVNYTYLTTPTYDENAAESQKKIGTASSNAMNRFFTILTEAPAEITDSTETFEDKEIKTKNYAVTLTEGQIATILSDYIKEVNEITLASGDSADSATYLQDYIDRLEPVKTSEVPVNFTFTSYEDLIRSLEIKYKEITYKASLSYGSHILEAYNLYVTDPDGDFHVNMKNDYTSKDSLSTSITLGDSTDPEFVILGITVDYKSNVDNCKVTLEFPSESMSSILTSTITSTKDSVSYEITSIGAMGVTITTNVGVRLSAYEPGTYEVPTTDVNFFDTNTLQMLMDESAALDQFYETMQKLESLYLGAGL